MVRIAVIPGDGISHEIMPEAVKTLETAHELYEFALDYEIFDYGVEHYLKTGSVVPEDIDDIITALPATFDAALFGAGGTRPSRSIGRKRSGCPARPQEGAGPICQCTAMQAAER